MSFLTTVAVLGAAYLIVRPFVLIKKLKVDVEDDLRDYQHMVRSFAGPIRVMADALSERDLMTEALAHRLSTAHTSLRTMETWDDVARADRLAVDAMDVALQVLDHTNTAPACDVVKQSRKKFDETDFDLIETRRLLFRDIPKLNGSFVHWNGLLRKLLGIPTYPMSVTIPWDASRADRYPVWKAYGKRYETLIQVRAPWANTYA